MRQRIIDWNARSWWVPVVLVKFFLAWALSAVTLALLVPALHTRGWRLQGWAVWAVIAGCVGLAVAPDLWNRYRSRRRG